MALLVFCYAPVATSDFRSYLRGGYRVRTAYSERPIAH